MKNIWYHIRQFFQSVNNLIIWFPIIFKDRQWDDFYFFEIMRKKLFLMEQFYRGPKAHHLNALRDAENIHIAVTTLDRMQSMNYLEEELLAYYAEYDELPGFDELEKDSEKSNLFGKCGRKANSTEQEDYDFLFDHLCPH